MMELKIIIKLKKKNLLILNLKILNLRPKIIKVEEI
jgi:hypothetical protein